VLRGDDEVVHASAHVLAPAPGTRSTLAAEIMNVASLLLVAGVPARCETIR